MSTEQDLVFKKLVLQQRSAVLRHSLAIQASRTIAPAIRSVERVQATGLWLKRHPALVVGVAAALLVWRPRAVMSLAGRAWTLWNTWQRIKPSLMLLVKKIGPSPDA